MWNDLCNWYRRRYTNCEPIVLLFTFALTAFIVLGASQYIAPVLTSIVIAYLMQGPMRCLERLKVPHKLALSVVYLLFVGCVLALVLWLFPLLWQEMLNVYRVLPEAIEKTQVLLSHLPQRLRGLVDASQLHALALQAQGMIAHLSRQALMYSISSIQLLFQLVIYLVLVPLMVLYFLSDSKVIANWVTNLLPREHGMVKQVWSNLDDQLGHYVRGKMVEFLIVAIVSSLAFFLIGLRYPILMGVLLGFSAFVPVVGGILVTIPVVIIGFWQWGWSGHFGHLVLLHSALLFLDGYVLVPWLFSNRLGLHPLAIILAVLIFGELWGMWGIFFAIPMACLLKAMLQALSLGKSSADAQVQ